MFDIQFKRNSEPIDDEDLRTVAMAVRANMERSLSARRADPNTDDYLLLAKMVFRIHALQQELADLRWAVALDQVERIRHDQANIGGLQNG